MHISWYRLQYGFFGFRIDGGYLHSYPTEDEARTALFRIVSRWSV